MKRGLVTVALLESLERMIHQCVMYLVDGEIKCWFKAGSTLGQHRPALTQR